MCLESMMIIQLVITYYNNGFDSLDMTYKFHLRYFHIMHYFPIRGLREKNGDGGL